MPPFVTINKSLPNSPIDEDAQLGDVMLIAAHTHSNGSTTPRQLPDLAEAREGSPIADSKSSSKDARVRPRTTSQSGTAGTGSGSRDSTPTGRRTESGRALSPALSQDEARDTIAPMNASSSAGSIGFGPSKRAAVGLSKKLGKSSFSNRLHTPSPGPRSSSSAAGDEGGGGGSGSSASHFGLGGATMAGQAQESSRGNGTAPMEPDQFSASATRVGGSTGGGGDGNTIAQLYAVFGLPKDPSVWTLAEEDCVAGVHHVEGAVGRFWRPEVLGCSICPSPSEVLARSTDDNGVSSAESQTMNKSGDSKWDGRAADGKKSQNPKFIEMSDGRGGIEKAETARVLSKALKLSFTREIEIISGQGNYPPVATSHTFSFSVPTITASGELLDKATGAVGVSVGKASAASGVGEGFGLEQSRLGDADDTPATFYGVVLTVWSAADERRSKTIKKELSRAAKQRVSAGSAGKSANKRSAAGGWIDIEGGAGGDENEAEADPSASSYSFLPANNTFFMPYAICIVSRYPLYDLLGDWNKMAWHKYSRNIEMHNQLMSTILRHPAPRLGEKFRVASPDKDVTFQCTFPGALEWGTGLIGTDTTMWPLFKSLSLDNVLTLCEIALAPQGRILFLSRHPAMLGVAVETIKYLVEMRGWRGVANQNCHARDVRIYLEDPGSWIIAINTELRSIIKPAKEVCVVDLDINFVNCPRPPVGAPSTKAVRERRRRKLFTALAISNVDYSPPREFVEAYPGGRLRPLSQITTRDRDSAYEQLARPVWWDQVGVISAFDKVLHEGSKPSMLKKFLKTRAATLARGSSGNDGAAGAATPAEMSAILALRRRASTFVDARDGLENKIGRLNKRLAFLMSESEMWRAQFAKIQQLVDRLTREANDLRSKLDKERRESRRLSSTLAQRDIQHVEMQIQLKETETAREEAMNELLKMQQAMDSLEQERESMMDEIRAVLTGTGGVEDVNATMSRLDLAQFFPATNHQFNPLSRSSSPSGSQASHTPSQAAEHILRSRALAEARISEGRPSRSRATSRAAAESSQGHGQRFEGQGGANGTSETASSVQHHFPDDQMNYEIQHRTSVVTNQISRIQQQLESTLTQLEGRRSGTYDRDLKEARDERRRRRISNASASSLRHEYGASSVGHGGADSSLDHNSTAGAGYDDDRRSEMDYTPVESVKDSRPSSRPQQRRQLSSGSATLNVNGNGNGNNNNQNNNTSGNGNGYGLRKSTSQSNLASVSASSSASFLKRQGSSGSLNSAAAAAAPPLTAKSTARPRNVSNPWKEPVKSLATASSSSQQALVSPSSVTSARSNDVSNETSTDASQAGVEPVTPATPLTPTTSGEKVNGTPKSIPAGGLSSNDEAEVDTPPASKPAESAAPAVEKKEIGDEKKNEGKLDSPTSEVLLGERKTKAAKSEVTMGNGSKVVN